MSLLALGLCGGPTASATVLCKTTSNPCFSPDGAGTIVEAKLGSKSVLHAIFGNIECSESKLQAEINKGGAEGINPSGSVYGFAFTGCNAKKVTLLKTGTFSISSPSEGNGTLTLEGIETTVEFEGIHCIYSGSISVPLKGGELASFEGTATLAHTGGRTGPFCGSTAEWTFDYEVSTPAPLFVEENSGPSVALCKTATNPCSNDIVSGGVGLPIEASLKPESKFSFKTSFGEVRCSESAIKGEVSDEGGFGKAASIAIGSLSLGECNCGVKVLQNGNLSIEEPAAGSGALVSNGLEITFECLETHCVYKTSSTSLGNLKGGEPATIAMEGSVPHTGGRSESSCGSAGTLSAEYKVSTPASLYVEQRALPSPVLCKTETDPCSAPYGKGTAIETELFSAGFHFFIGTVECREGVLIGEVSSSEGVSGPVSSLTFKECNGRTVKVLKPVTLAIRSAGLGNGTLELRNFEIEYVEGTGKCFYTGSGSLSIKGGEHPSVSGALSLVSTNVFCESIKLTLEYFVPAPAPLFVEEI